MRSQYSKLVHASLYMATMLFFSTATSAHAQETTCGTKRPDPRSVINRGFSDEQIHLNRSGAIPIIAHVFEKNGVAIADDALVDEWIQSAAIHFNFLSAPFEVESIDHFSGEERQELSISESSDLLRKYNGDQRHKVHIIFTVSQPGMCGVTSLPPSTSQGIVVSVNDSCDVSVVLAHELGHFFMLQHTHENVGTEEAEQVSRDQDNCLYKGDGLCDTPADPTLSMNNVNNQCQYHGHAKDQDGKSYDPDTHNLMSYTRESCADRFTADQRTLVEQVYAYLVVDPNKRASNDISLGVKISEVFPNPASGDQPVTIHYQSKGSIRVQAFILDVAGRIVWSKTDVPALDGMGEVVWVPQGNLPSGTYLAVVTTVRGKKANAKTFFYSR